MATVASRTTRLANGVGLSYIDEGEPSGPLVVLLGGLTDSWRTFELVIPHLRASVRAIAVSARGHGDSDKPESGYRTADFAADVALFLASLELEKAVIVGHSSASFVARRFALDNPTRTAGVVLESSPLTLRGNPTLERLVAALATMSDPLDPKFVSDFVAGTVKSVDPNFQSEMAAESGRVPLHVWRQAFEALLHDDDTAELPAVGAPTLLIWGDRDSLVPREHQERLASLIRSSRLATYAGVGHTPHWEAPERFAADLVAFVRSLPS